MIKPFIVEALPGEAYSRFHGLISLRLIRIDLNKGIIW